MAQLCQRMLATHQSQSWARSVPASGRARRGSIASTCTLSGTEEDSDVIEHDLIDLTLDEPDTTRHDFVVEDEARATQVHLSNDCLRPGDFVQVSNTSFSNYKIEFVLVKSVVRGSSGDEAVRGIPFARTRCMLGKLPKKLNEVCMLCQYNQAPGTINKTPVLIDVAPASIEGKRSLIVTNALYPLHNPKHTTFTLVNDPMARTIAVEEHGTLVCRWKLEVHKVEGCRFTKHYEEVITRVPADEVPDRRFRVDETALREAWRGETIRGGSWKPRSDVQVRPDRDDCSLHRRQGQKYTVFDSFCGAGGVSRGAEMAGYRVQYAVDKSPNVWETYQTNFPDCSLHRASVDDFIRNSTNRLKMVDVLHLSPPCQPFSPAHTHAAAHDDENIFALMGCFSLIRMTRPRIVTLEQTFGITHERHGEYMRVLINDFTAQGFSLRWRIVRLASWGSAQDRKRMILIAAAPGESLPPFPNPSHSEDGIGRMKPLNTIEKALSQVRRGDDLHDLETVRRHDPPKTPFRGDKLAGTVTTRPGGFYYPDGTRDLTLREYAALQGFPKNHIFIGNRTSILRQIGNAFPPNTVRHLYKHLEKWLLEQDGMIDYQPQASEIMVLDVEPDPSRRANGQRRFAALPGRGQARRAVGIDVMEICAPVAAAIIDLT